MPPVLADALMVSASSSWRPEDSQSSSAGSSPWRFGRKWRNRGTGLMAGLWLLLLLLVSEMNKLTNNVSFFVLEKWCAQTQQRSHQRRHVLYLRIGVHKHRTSLSEETCTVLEKQQAQTQDKPFRGDMYYTWETADTNTGQAFQRRHILYLRNGTHKHSASLSEETRTILEKLHAQTQHKPFFLKRVLSQHQVNPNWLENQQKRSHEKNPNAHPGCTSLFCPRPAFESDDQKGPLSSFPGRFSAELFLMRCWKGLRALGSGRS